MTSSSDGAGADHQSVSPGRHRVHAESQAVSRSGPTGNLIPVAGRSWRTWRRRSPRSGRSTAGTTPFCWKASRAESSGALQLPRQQSQPGGARARRPRRGPAGARGREPGEVRDPFTALQRILAQHRAVAVPGFPRFTAAWWAISATTRSATWSGCPPRPPPTWVSGRRLPADRHALDLRQCDAPHHGGVQRPRAGPERPRRRADLPGIAAEDRRDRRGVAATGRRATGFAGSGRSAEPDSTFSRQGFCEAVQKAKAYIQAGDAIQVVLSQRLALTTEADPSTCIVRCAW